MYHNNAIIRPGAMVVLAALSALASPLRYSLAGVSESSVTITITLPASPCADVAGGDDLFAFSTLPQVSFTATASMTIAGGEVSLPVRTLGAGWMDNDYLQWIGIDRTRLPANRPQPLYGSLVITFGAPFFAGITATSVTLMNNMLLYTTRGKVLAKAAAAGATIPRLPYAMGVQLGIDKDGIYSLSYETLAAAGVPLSRIPAKRFRLYVRGHEIPLSVSARPDAPLAAGDVLMFYGEYLRAPDGRRTQFSNTNVYWLTWSDTAVGIRMALVSGAQRRDETRFSVDTVELRAREMNDTIVIEEDNDIRWFGGIDNPGEMVETSATEDSIDNWYWGFVGADELTSYTVTLPSPSRTGQARLRIGLMGLTSVESEPLDHRVRILVNNNPAGQNNIASWDGQKPHIFESDPFPVSLLTAGKNTVSFIVDRRAYQDRCVLNWIAFEYPRSFRSASDRTVFKSGSNAVGKVTMFEVTGFTSPTLDLWDIQKHRIFAGFETRRGTGNDKNLYSLLFQDSIPSPTTYFVQASALRQEPAWLKLDTINSGWDTVAKADYLVIGPPWARPVVAPLCEVHARRGLTPAFVDINDIYSQFSWGIRDPESIRSMLTALSASAGGALPRFLLLAGDCTHDLDKKNPERTAVPTRLSHVPGWGAASNDDYFAVVRGEDQFPDLCVGRFPAENPEQLATLVAKTTAYIQSPSRGFWRDNLLLASGYESEFTAFTSNLSQSVVGPRMNIVRMDADPRSPFYKDELTASATMANYINQGVHLLSFNGHGGGNIWSDSRFFGYEDLGRLHNGEWDKSGRLPVVFSFTCLTGFFESVFYRSLGEEMIRTNKNGAICFYGASAYTSKKGNLQLNWLLLDMALSADSTTVGELVRAAEIAMIAQNGPASLPLVRQYNLLGDPALPWRLTPDTLHCSLAKNALSSGDSLSFKATCDPVVTGSANLTVGSGTALWNRSLTQVSNGSIAQTFGIKEATKTASGMIRAYAWNDSFEVRGWTFFSKDTVMVRNLSVSPSRFGFGDTVSVSCAIDKPSDSAASSVFCLYAVASPHTENPPFTGIRMQEDEHGRWTVSQGVPLAFAGDLNAMLLIRFRVMTDDMSKESAVSTFSIMGRPDLTFTGSTLPIAWIRDSLRATFEILNIGNSAAPSFDVTLFWGSEPGSAALSKLVCRDGLGAGKTWSGTVALPDTAGTVSVTAVINAGETFEEVTFVNNRAGGTITATAGTLMNRRDTLWSRGGGCALVPAREFAEKRTVFLFDSPITDARPLPTGSRWLPLRGDSMAFFMIGARPALAAGDSLVWHFFADSLPKGLSEGATQTATGKVGVMLKDSALKSWRFGGATRSGGSPWTGVISREQGPYALAFLEDTKPPSIQVSVYGKEIRFLDYAAKDQPFNILIADPSGVVPASILVRHNKKALAADRQSVPSNPADLRNLTVTTYPPRENRVDSLVVVANDLAGNTSEHAFAYQPGEDLDITFFSCHPNPFSLRARGVNGPPQKVYFAFTLTNAAEVTVSIYTIRGKRIISWKANLPAGYTEFPPQPDISLHSRGWDGRDKDGYRIANGTYYAKLVAKNGSKTVKKTIRIAKLEGY